MQDYRLKAIDLDKGIFRWYEIKPIQDLFGHWSLIVSFGRINTKGRTKIISFDTVEEMHTGLHKILKKRLTAKNRIGCNYTLIT